jgi:hypothetical protein
MRVIHFTSPAADPLKGFDASGASFLPLADGGTHISCLHLEMDGKVESPSLTHATALLPMIIFPLIRPSWAWTSREMVTGRPQCVPQASRVRMTAG